MRVLWFLQLSSVAEIAGIAKARHNVFVLIQSLVDGGAPDSGLVIGESVLDVLNTLGSCQYTSYMDVLGRAFRENGLQS